MKRRLGWKAVLSLPACYRCFVFLGRGKLRITTGLTNCYGNSYQIYVSPTLRELFPLLRASNHRFSERWLSPEGRPAHTFSTLISSSRSGQWMPSPRPMIRQLLRSWGVPCNRRGYHSKGTLMLRPSIKSIIRDSSSIEIRSASVG